jgi:uncharacterized membrane protein YeaQ/YmgE (transglycosylase-associated protein family)
MRAFFNGWKQKYTSPCKEERLMASLITQSLVLASGGITIQIGNHAWTFSSSLIVYAIIAAVVGLIAELLVGWRLPFGIIGAIIAGIVGVWLTTQVIIITGVGDIVVDQVQIIRGVIGAAILIAAWHLITYPVWRGRGRYGRG